MHSESVVTTALFYLVIPLLYTFGALCHLWDKFRLFRLPFHIFRKVSPPCLPGTAPSLFLPTRSLYCSPDTFGLTRTPLCVALALCGNPSFPKSFYTSSKAYLYPTKCPATLPTSSYQALALLNIPPHKQPTLTLPCTHTVGHHSPFYNSVC